MRQLMEIELYVYVLGNEKLFFSHEIVLNFYYELNFFFITKYISSQNDEYVKELAYFASIPHNRKICFVKKKKTFFACIYHCNKNIYFNEERERKEMCAHMLLLYHHFLHVKAFHSLFFPPQPLLCINLSSYVSSSLKMA